MEAPPGLKRKRILVVDDNTVMRSIARKSLEVCGYDNIVEAKDGKEGLNILSSGPVDVVMCDWEMPNMSGIELFGKMRVEQKLRNIPFVMMTTESRKGKVVEALDAGITNYIVKPFSPETLCEKVTKMLETNAHDRKSVA